jgi:hypothetical protein
MDSIYAVKTREITSTPVLAFDCELRNGAVERWSTHAISIAGKSYSARVLQHSVFDLKAAADDGLDGIAKISLTLANADGYFSQIERSAGWKGARLTVRFYFLDLVTGESSPEEFVLFKGAANPPDLITENSFRLTFANRLNLHRVLLPSVRIQRRCPWFFPATQQQREQAVSGGAEGRYSLFFPCGYSADQPGGVGNLQNGQPFTGCDRTRQNCTERGMFDRDSSGKVTRRFGGIEFVPASILVRSAGEKGYHPSTTLDNQAKFNDFVPLVYGTAWYQPPIIFARNDGNLTHLELLLGLGPINRVLKVIANQIEIPEGQAGANMTATGWFNVVSYGERQGAFNLSFQDAAGNPAGDPYGGLAVLSLVLPNRISDGKTFPRVQVLLEGLKLDTYDGAGNFVSTGYTNNPAWVLLDVLRRTGWQLSEMDLPSFTTASAWCDQPAECMDVHGRSVIRPAFQCNLVLQRRRSAADLLRSIRNAAGLYLRYNEQGKLQLCIEGALAQQHPVKPPGSNAREPLNGGWPAYEFGDGSNGAGDIVRKPNGEPSIRFFSRSTADTPNRFALEFQDELNVYQQDSFSIVDVEDVAAAGQEITGAFPVEGIANVRQAAYITRIQLDRSVRGNLYVEFETSVRAIGLKPGDLITLTWLREGYNRQPFRIVKISPGLNFGTAMITAQIHNDEWYLRAAAENGILGAGRISPQQPGLPRPLAGTALDSEGYPQFGVEERFEQSADGAYQQILQVSFGLPPRLSSQFVSPPIVSLGARVETTGGSLPGDRRLYYAVTAVDNEGAESELSFTVPVTIPPGTNTNKVILRDLSFPPGAVGFSVYRGPNPTMLYRIAAARSLSATFEDSGLAASVAPPPDPNFDHANFYWRLELLPQTPATRFSSTMIGSDIARMIPNEYRDQVVRIQAGKGRGQERRIIANTEHEIAVATPWETIPDATSEFVVVENGWQFGAMAKSSPVSFPVPNRQNTFVHLSGRAANVNDVECAYELSPLTRWELGSRSGSGQDGDVPPRPAFGLSTLGNGVLEVAGISFPTLDNTRTITAASLTIHYWDELNSPSTARLLSAVTDSDGEIRLQGLPVLEEGALLQLEREIVKILRRVADGRYAVTRGDRGTTAQPHPADTTAYLLQRRTVVLPFVRSFFGTPASGSYSFPVYLPNARVAAAEMIMTNARGASETSPVAVTHTIDQGLRTLSGGQIVLQVDGFLAIQSGAIPPFIVESSYAVGAIRAFVREAPAATPLLVRVKRNGATYADLTIDPGQTQSIEVSGFGKPPLLPGTVLDLDIVSAGGLNDGSPGRDLTVILAL